MRADSHALQQGPERPKLMVELWVRVCNFVLQRHTSRPDGPVSVPAVGVPKISNVLELTVWMNMPSPYQADLFRTLERLPEVELDVVYARRLTMTRRRLGWK